MTEFMLLSIASIVVVLAVYTFCGLETGGSLPDIGV
jgi:hypothetical protein